MVSTKYIMKCDDDTFVRVDAVIEQAHRVNSQKSVYAGKMNYYHMPLRSGKWAVTYEVFNLSETLSYEHGMYPDKFFSNGLGMAWRNLSTVC